MKEKIFGGFFGLAVGDALGVPVEFKKREELKKYPVFNMKGYGTYNLPPGTWSDDSSLAFCLAESICERKGIDYYDIADKFVKWLFHGYWTPLGEVFDYGSTTYRAIDAIHNGTDPLEAGPDDEYTISNGAMMRILPLALYLYSQKNLSLDKKIEFIHNVTKITHGHPLVALASDIYIIYALELLDGQEKQTAFQNMVQIIKSYYEQHQKSEMLDFYDRVLSGEIQYLEEDDINSSGYAKDTLEAIFWSFLTTEDYSQAVLKAVNLGYDTDTMGAITGGIAGIYYGYSSIPDTWKKMIARFDDIYNLADCFLEKFY